MSPVDAVRLGLELSLEDALHLFPDGNSLRRLGVLNVVPAEALVLLDSPLEHEAVGKADGQTRDGHRVLRRHELTVDGEATLAVQLLANLEVALGRRDDIASPRLGLTRRLAAAHDAGDGHAQLEADQMVRLVLRCVPTARVGLEAVLLEALLLVLARGCKTLALLHIPAGWETYP